VPHALSDVYIHKIQVSLQSDNNIGYSKLTSPYVLIIFRVNSCQSEVSDKSCGENQRTQFAFRSFSRKSCRLRDNREKYCTAGQATHDEKEHALSMLDTLGYKHTLRICDTHCSSTATMVTRTRLISIKSFYSLWSIRHP
jgi:hypothetical protein